MLLFSTFFVAHADEDYNFDDSTPYSANSFCSKNAGTFLKNLEDLNKKNYETIKNKKVEADNISTESIPTSKVRALVVGYLSSLLDNQKFDLFNKSHQAIKTLNQYLEKSNHPIEDAPPSLTADLKAVPDKSKLITEFKNIIRSIPEEISPLKTDDKTSQLLQKCINNELIDKAECKDFYNLLLKLVSNENEDLKLKIETQLENLKDEITATNNKAQEKASKVQIELETLLTDPTYKAIENLKKYVAEKYVKNCGTDGKIETKKLIPLQNANNIDSPCGFESVFQNQSLISLVTQTGNIFKNTYFAKDINLFSPSENEGFDFSKAEYQQFDQSCKQISKENLKGVNKLCEKIQNEKKKRDNHFDLDFWENTGSDFYSDGTQKSSNFRIMAEGILPVLPTLIPPMFQNYYAQQQINYLTDYAIANKQYMHNFQFYQATPWMINPGAYFMNTFYYQNLGSISPGVPGFKF